MLKLSKSGGEGDKVFLLLESGARFHTTQVCRCHRSVCCRLCMLQSAACSAGAFSNTHS